MAPLKVLIVGGGITGPSLGFWLSKLDSNCDITIVERFPDLRVSGQQIDIRGEGIAVMRRMGIEPAVRARVVQEPGTMFIDEQGNTQAFFEANKTGQGRQSLTSEFEIMRRDLVRILYDLTKDKCNYIFGTTVDDFENRGDGVHVKFSDGREDDFDLMVGADGQGSRTRRRLFPATDDHFDFKKLYLSYFTVPQTEKDSVTKAARILLLPGDRAIFTRVDNPKTMQVYLAAYDRHLRMDDLKQATRTGDVQRQKEIWYDIFKGVGWEVPRIMDDMMDSPAAKDFYGQQIGQVKVDKWYKGRVILLGDAGYCPSPITGKGTSVGLLGPYVLAGELAKHARTGGGASEGAKYDVDAALESYDKKLRPLIEEVQSLPSGVPGLVYAETEWGVRLRYFVLRLITTLRIHKLLGRLSSDNFGGTWKLPEYPELKYDTK